MDDVTDQRQHPHRALHARVRRVGEQHYVSAGTEAFELSDVGLSIWKLCDGRHDTGAIAEQVAADYDVDVDRARADVEEFVEALGDAGLLR